MLETLYTATARVSKTMAWVMGYVLLATALLVSVEVVLRKLFSISFGGMDEISGYVLIILSAWGFSFALVARSHIRIDLLHAQLPRIAQAILDILSLLSLGVLAVLLAYYGFFVLESSWKIGTTANTPLRTPLWIPQSLWVAGLIFFCVTLFIILLRCLVALMGGQSDMVRHLAGTTSTEDEVGAELEHTRKPGKTGESKP